MKRALIFMSLFIIAVPLGAFAVSLLHAVIYAFLNLDFEASKAWNDNLYYMAGVVAGWWVWGDSKQV